MKSFLSLLLLTLLAVVLSSKPGQRELVGPLPDGSTLLSTGWRISPAGKQTTLDTLPMSMALSRDGKYLLALNAGYLPPSISVLNAESGERIDQVHIPDGWLGLAFSTEGDRLYVGGAAQAAVLEYRFDAGKLEAARTFPLVTGRRTPQDFIGDVALSPDGRSVYAADLYHDSIAVFDLESGKLVRHFKTGSRPYRLRFTPDGQSLLVSGWADATVYEHRASDGEILRTARVGAHPTDMLFVAASGSASVSGRSGQAGSAEASPYTSRPPSAAAGRWYVACANTNAVYVLDGELQVREKINVSLTPRQPVGMTPSALAATADGKRLFIVCSDANSVAVSDISGAESRVLGFIPAGWYPTAVEALAGGRLAVLNSRGQRSYPNPEGPNPGMRPATWHKGLPEDHQYVGRMQLGSLSLIERFDAKQLSAWTRTVIAGCPYRDSQLDDAGSGSGPVPSRPGLSSPIKHVVYIIKENRTYDQVLGDMKEGNGDPSLTLFGEDVTPNHHKLAREFVLLDNFYVNADVSADGHNWSTAAISPDYVQKMWGTSYGGRRNNHDYYGPGDVAAQPPSGYIWNRVAARGLSIRNYGYHAENLRQPAPDGRMVRDVGDPVLKPVTNLYFRGFDMNFPEKNRAEVYVKELAEYEEKGEMPAFEMIYLGGDHTSGTSPGRTSPRSMVADNDFALGMIVEALSKSRFWGSTAIFVLEDDAQNGPDHVDSHRSPAFVISPYIRRHVVSSAMYNTTSMLRTIELILGLPPMTYFDAGARPMAALFQAKPDLSPYVAEEPRIPLDTKNPRTSATAARSARMNFSEPDDIDEDALNDILWLAIRGTNPPAPVRSYFSK